MALTAVTITGTFEREDGTNAEGSVTATLSHRIKNGTVTVEPTPVVGVLRGGKLLSQGLGPFVLLANDDAGTEPAGTTYSFVVALDNAPTREFYAVVSKSPTTVDITTLEPA